MYPIRVYVGMSLWLFGSLHNLSAADKTFEVGEAGYNAELKLEGLVEGLRQSLEIKLVNATGKDFSSIQVSTTCSCVRASTDVRSVQPGGELSLGIEIDPPQVTLDQHVTVHATDALGTPVELANFRLTGKSTAPVALDVKYLYISVDKGAELVLRVPSAEFELCNLPSLEVDDARLKLDVIAANQELGPRGGCKVRLTWRQPDSAPPHDITVAIKGYFALEEQLEVPFEEKLVIVFRPRLELSPSLVRLRTKDTSADFNTLTGTVLLRDYGTRDTELSMMLVANAGGRPLLLDPDILHNYDRVKSKIGSSAVQKITLVATLVQTLAVDDTELFVVAYKRSQPLCFNKPWQEFISCTDVFPVVLE